MKSVSVPRLPRWRWIVSVWLLALPVIGCVAMDDRIDHSVRIVNVGQAKIVDLTYSYGNLGPRSTPRLGRGGDGVTMPMPIPDIIDVKWTTEADGRVHEAHVPLKSKVSAEDVSGKTVSIELDGSLLKVFLVKRLPDFKEERKQVY